MGLTQKSEDIMTEVTKKNQLKIDETVKHLQDIQAQFRADYFAGKKVKKLPKVCIDFDRKKIVLYIYIDDDVDIEVSLNTEYNCMNFLTGISVDFIELDSYSEGSYFIVDTDNDALLLEAKKLIHDAEFYGFSEDEIETDFYNEVYA